MVQPTIEPAPAAATGRATALVVDGNATSRRFVELALAQSGSFNVEAAQDAAGALEILKTQLVDLVVSDTDLADANGLAFYRRLLQESRLKSVPFVFLSTDRAVHTKVAALRAGVDDYLVKPCDVAELVARAEALVARRRRHRDALRTRAYSLAGDFSGMAFTDLVATIEMGRKSGVLSIVTGHALGRVYFDAGAVVHATYGNLAGEVAFQRIFGESAGQFEFLPGPCPVAQDAWTIEETVTGLIMEAARLLDTSAHATTGASSTFATPAGDYLRDTTSPPAGSPLLRLEPPLVGDTMLAAQLELALRDPFALGELRVWTHDELERWTRREVGSDRFHVLLVADMAAGVSSMLALAGGPTERWVLDSLRPERKAFGLTFFLRHERTIDVVLVDARAPTSLVTSLGRTPSVVLVCPPDGDFFALGTAAHVGLGELLDATAPPAVVGLGHGALDQALSSMRAVRGGGTLRCAAGSLGEGADDLRSVLIKGIRLWAATGATERATVRPPTSRGS